MHALQYNSNNIKFIFSVCFAIVYLYFPLRPQMHERFCIHKMVKKTVREFVGGTREPCQFHMWKQTLFRGKSLRQSRWPRNFQYKSRKEYCTTACICFINFPTCELQWLFLDYTRIPLEFINEIKRKTVHLFKKVQAYSCCCVEFSKEGFPSLS